MKVRDVVAALETWAPAGLAYSWDKAGLSIGSPDSEVSAALVALTVTPEAVTRAVAAGAHLIVSHHPLIWEPLKTLRTDDPHTRLCLELASLGIACYSAHTNLDVAPRGVSHVLARQLGLAECRPLFAGDQGEQVKLVTFVPEEHLDKVRAAVCDAGAGIIGDYTYCTYSGPGQGTFIPGIGTDPFVGEKGALNIEDERRLETVVWRSRLDAVLRALRTAHPYEVPAYDVVPMMNPDARVGLGVRGVLPEPMRLDALARHAIEALELDHVRLVGDADAVVRTVAVMGGSGGGSIARVPRDVDVFITGDVKYHEALDARTQGLAVIDAGHAGTEKGIVPALAGYLQSHCPGLTVATYVEDEIFRVVEGSGAS